MKIIQFKGAICPILKMFLKVSADNMETKLGSQYAVSLSQIIGRMDVSQGSGGNSQFPRYMLRRWFCCYCLYIV